MSRGFKKILFIEHLYMLVTVLNDLHVLSYLTIRTTL